MNGGLSLPELPEVETVRRSLTPHLTGRSITEVQIFLPKIVRYLTVDEFKQQLLGQRFLKLDRRGKYLLARLTGGWTLVVHLKMTGRLIYGPPGLVINRDGGAWCHLHAAFSLDNGGVLVFHDLRQFGYLTLIQTEDCLSLKGLKDLGPEPLGQEFTLNWLEKKVQGRKAKIKQLLLDQTIVAGIGNIYADEILYAAKLHPERIGASLTADELARLYQSIRSVLQQGIDCRGTSISDYVDGEGQPGEFQNYLQVYRRTGQDCRHCASVIQRLKVGGRSSHYCPQCQPNVCDHHHGGTRLPRSSTD